LGLDVHLRVAHPGITQRASLPDLIAGTAEKPFVLRALIPDLVAAVDAAVPRRWQNGVERALLRRGGVTFRHRLAALAWNDDALFEYVVASVVTYGALVGFAVTLRALYRRLFPERRWAAALVPLFALGAMPLFLQQGAHFYYDFATLLLFTAALFAVA